MIIYLLSLFIFYGKKKKLKKHWCYSQTTLNHNLTGGSTYCLFIYMSKCRYFTASTTHTIFSPFSISYFTYIHVPTEFESRPEHTEDIYVVLLYTILYILTVLVFRIFTVSSLKIRAWREHGTKQDLTCFI